MFLVTTATEVIQLYLCEIRKSEGTHKQLGVYQVDI